VKVTLAESRQKKAVFLREMVRSLGLRSEVWAGRVEAMPEERQFDVVAMRAVDDMRAAVGEAARRARGRVMIVGSSGSTAEQGVVEGLRVEESITLPGLAEGVLLVMRRC
jgi:16S rRNA (guanine527-N7)-methyltransferase